MGHRAGAVVRDVVIAQHTETSVASEQRSRFGFRYGYARSADSQQHGDPGEDFLAVREDTRRLAFVLCDGVSQSFFGGICARRLGQAVLDFIWSQPLASESTALQTDVTGFLEALRPEVAQALTELALPTELPAVLRQVLEDKRRRGSESMLLAGLLDTLAGRLTLIWIGDSRLRLWGPVGEVTTEWLPATSFDTRERWSSRRGVIGVVHGAVVPLASVVRLAAYSDGLAGLDRWSELPSDPALDGVIAQTRTESTSDDVSVCEVWLGRRRTDPQELGGSPSASPSLMSPDAEETLPVAGLTPARAGSEPTSSKRRLPRGWGAVGAGVVSVGLLCGGMWGVGNWLAATSSTPTRSPAPSASPTIMRSPTSTGTATPTRTVTLTLTTTTSATSTATTTATTSATPSVTASASAAPTVDATAENLDTPPVPVLIPPLLTPDPGSPIHPPLESETPSGS